jgi:hypothetical protein
MKDLLRPVTKLPPEQEAIRAKCFHPTGTFVEFEKERVEQSIPQRFDRIVRQHPEWIAVKTKATQVISPVRETFHPQFPLRAQFESDRRGVGCPNHPKPGWPHCAPEMMQLMADLESVSDEKAQLSLDHATLSIK